MSSIRLSPEQEAILATAEPPNASSSKLVRITAAAGTGKTTTLLHLAEKCAQLGHTHLTYITFNKSAAADGRARLEQTLGGGKYRIHLEARTLHSCAMMLLCQARGEDNYDDVEVETRVIDEEELKNEIQSLLRQEIHEFLRPCFREIFRIAQGDPEKRSLQIQSMEASAVKQVVFFLYKTLVQFCHSQNSLEMFRTCWERDYYPVKKFHSEARAQLAGFSLHIYNTKQKISWYADQANRLWEMLGKVRCYDLEMKRAQLMKLKMPGTLILVDECQDMDGCQVAWVSEQYQNSKKLLYMVGDAAQTIYSFRGAKSKYMMELPFPATDRTLTTSWRFGPSIARMANVVLFCKEHCPQTLNTKKKTWQPYRVTGGSLLPCQVTDEKLPWQSYKVTLIAFQNVTLMMEALAMLGMMPPTRGDEDEVIPIVSEDGADSRHSEPIVSMPKFHINGKGDNSGLKKWRQVKNQVEHIYALFASTDGMVLPRRQFPEFAGQPITWQSFVIQVRDREINRLVASMNVVQAFRDRTLEAMDLFYEEVMNKAYSAEEADIILSTCHAAKGMEWDNVQLCEDFMDEVSRVDYKGPPKTVFGEDGTLRRILGWQFATKEFGDDLNLLYVACTRAKRLLSISSPLKMLLEQCDMLHDIVQAKERVKEENPAPKRFKSAGTINLFQKKLSDEQAADLYKELVLKLRTDAGLLPNQKLMDELLTRMNPEDPKNYVESYPDAAASSEATVINEPAEWPPDRVKSAC
jgi:superfamily I DNA/RNA helicase